MRLNNDLGTLEDPEVCYILTLVPTATATGGICTNGIGSDSDPCQGNTPTPNPTPTPTATPTSGRINWTVSELQQICLSAKNIGLAFIAQTGRTVTPQIIFKEVMGVEDNNIRDQGEIELIRVNNRPNCLTSNNYRTITCGNLVDYQGVSRAITEYVITHEFGHMFDNQADRGNGRALRDYIGDTSLPLTPTAVGTHVGGAIFDANGNVVMGSVSICNNEWLRGERGWGSGPGSRYSTPPTICAPQGQLFTDFQQNPAPYGTTGQANEETAADMFLNWVYRKLASGGFLNRDWRPHVTATPTGLPCSQTPGGCDDSAAGSGNARFNWMETVMDEIFAARNWNS